MELPRNTVAVHLEGKDHVVTGAEITRCGLDVPYKSEWLTDLPKPCPICFPESVPDKPAKADAKTKDGKVI